MCYGNDTGAMGPRQTLRVLARGLQRTRPGRVPRAGLVALQPFSCPQNRRVSSALGKGSREVRCAENLPSLFWV